MAAVQNGRHHTRRETSGPDSNHRKSTSLRSGFGRVDAQKRFLDAGFSPDMMGVEWDRLPAGELQVLLERSGREEPLSGLERLELEAREFVFRGHPIAEHDEPASREVKLSFVVCVSDDRVLQQNLLDSPDLRPGTVHEIILVRNCRSAAEGLNMGLERARHAIVVCVHQDVYLPKGWCSRFARKWEEAQARFARLGVVGVYGIAGRDVDAKRVGHVVDRTRLLRESTVLPAKCGTLDEVVLAVPKDTPIRFEPSLGFHLYGADVCLAGQEKGLTSVVVDVPCLHNSSLTRLPEEFGGAKAVFARKWAMRLPVITPCAAILKANLPIE